MKVLYVQLWFKYLHDSSCSLFHCDWHIDYLINDWVRTDLHREYTLNEKVVEI